MSQHQKRDYLTPFQGHFPGEPALACFIEAKDDGGCGDNWSYKMCKAPVKSSSPTNQYPVILQAGCSSCYQQCQRTAGKASEMKLSQINKNGKQAAAAAAAAAVEV